MAIQFDPKIHLAYAPPESRITMEELGKAGEGVSPVGVTQPFPLLSEEGVLALRQELFTPSMFERCGHGISPVSCQLRGISCRPGYAPFNESLWTHPETIRAVSDAAGIDLVPIMRYEFGHANIQLNPGEGTLSKLGRVPLRAEVPIAPQGSAVPKMIPDYNKLPTLVPSTHSDTESEEEVGLSSPVPSEDKESEPAIVDYAVPRPKELEPEKKEYEPIVPWHRDSYPWACIIMLSDSSTMQGGETALACADGTTKKIRGPQMGWAIMLQGRYIDHAALRAYNAPERVTMVTSYRVKDVMTPDDSILSPLRAVGHHNEMYYDWSTYRLDFLSERFKQQSEALKKKRGNGQGPWGEELLNKDVFKAWCKEQIKYLETTVEGIN